MADLNSEAASAGPNTDLVSGVGVDLRLGVQLNDWLAVMCQLNGAIFELDFRIGLLLELTPFRYFSVAAGIGLDAIDTLALSSPPPNEGANGWMVPIRVALNIPLSSLTTRRRSAVAIAITLMPGSAIDGYPTEVGHPFEFGAVGGISFELTMVNEGGAGCGACRS